MRISDWSSDVCSSDLTAGNTTTNASNIKNSRTATPLGFNTGLRAGTALLAWNHRCRHDTISPAGTKRDPAPALPVAMNDEPVRACPHRGKHAGDRSTRRASVESRGNDDQK